MEYIFFIQIIKNIDYSTNYIVTVINLYNVFSFSKPIKDAWDFKKSSLRNMKEMGLANDPNKVIKISNFKQDKVKLAKKIVNQESLDDDDDDDEELVQPIPKKEVVEILEKEARAPRPRRFM